MPQLYPSSPPPLDYGIEDLPESGLSAVAESAQALRASLAEKERLEAELKRINAEVLRIETQELPAAMKALGVESWTLTGGDVITLKEEIHTGLSGPKEAAAFDWLRATGNESIIKRTLLLSFGRGEDDIAAELSARLREELPDNEIVDKAAIHAGTLKAFVKEQITLERALSPVPGRDDVLRNDAGDLFPKIPRDVFGVFCFDRATIKKPKTTTKGD